MTRTTTHSGTDSVSSAAPAALGAGEGALWFLGVLAPMSAASTSTAGRVAVIEHRASRGSGSPLHVHGDEDEWFYVLEGELTCWVGGQVITAGPGSFVYGPREIPHTFTVSSEHAQFVLVTAPAGFEGWVRESGEPAPQRAVAPAATETHDVERLAAVAARYGVEILGPPGIPV